MVGNAHRIFLKLLINLQFKAEGWTVTPNLNSLVGGACGNQVLFDADIHARDRSRMERMNQVLVRGLYTLGLVIEQADIHPVNLVVIGCEDQLILSSR